MRLVDFEHSIGKILEHHVRAKCGVQPQESVTYMAMRCAVKVVARKEAGHEVTEVVVELGKVATVLSTVGIYQLLEAKEDYIYFNWDDKLPARQIIVFVHWT